MSTISGEETPVKNQVMLLDKKQHKFAGIIDTVLKVVQFPCLVINVKIWGNLDET
ncbi:hypothetical protein [Nodularia sp. NIES-3585]|uniref:hypothetical protein n=1 Tax=Nodularia sp. NIES-3585 TaxID=1973477 RepID=UPI001C3D3F5E|nr:hypothetical protein [Nodularia sp. NIES-3585]